MEDTPGPGSHKLFQAGSSQFIQNSVSRFSQHNKTFDKER
jgi:hypothetical protein